MIYTIVLNQVIQSVYKNIGQEAERRLNLAINGTERKADNKPHTFGGDIGDIQVKSARATVCKGTDIIAYLEADGANRYAYVTKDFSIAYIMTRSIYIEFVKMFATLTRESTKNGGGIKMRLKHESKEMLKWLNERI